MVNENLKNAISEAGLTPEQFAETLRVDPKSVQRWVSGNTIPYRKHRAAISRALDLAEHELWPDQTPAPDNTQDAIGIVKPCDVTGTWAYADEDTAPDLVAFITDTTGPIDLLDSCCGLEITAEITDALVEQADAGRQIRILTDGQAPCWEPLLEHQQIELYLSEIPGEYWLIKTSERMLLTINLQHEPAGQTPPPLLELTATSNDGLFHRLTGTFEELWALTSETDTAEPAAAEPVEAAADLGVMADTQLRRWPGRHD